MSDLPREAKDAAIHVLNTFKDPFHNDLSFREKKTLAIVEAAAPHIRTQERQRIAAVIRDRSAAFPRVNLYTDGGRDTLEQIAQFIEGTIQ